MLFSIIVRVSHLPLQFILNSWNFKCHKMSIIELECSFMLSIDIRSSIKLDEKKPMAAQINLSVDRKNYALKNMMLEHSDICFE